MLPLQGRKRKWLAPVLLWILAHASATTSLAQTVSVTNGASLSLGSGTLTTGCGDVNVAGILSVGSGSVLGTRNVSIAGGTLNGDFGLVSLSGDWTNSGTFNPGSGTVAIVDGCGTTSSNVVGDNTFATFNANSSSGKQLTIAAGSTQTFQGSLGLNGASGNRMLVRSSSAGTSANFVLSQGASQSIRSVDVADNNASSGEVIAPGPPQSFDSINSGNVVNWFIGALQPIAVNTLPLPALLLLIVAMGLLLRRKLVALS